MLTLKQIWIVDFKSSLFTEFDWKKWSSYRWFCSSAWWLVRAFTKFESQTDFNAPFLSSLQLAFAAFSGVQCDEAKNAKDELLACSKQCIQDHEDDDKFDDEKEEEYNQCEEDCSKKFMKQCVAACEKHGWPKSDCPASRWCNPRLD